MYYFTDILVSMCITLLISLYQCVLLTWWQTINTDSDPAKLCESAGVYCLSVLPTGNIRNIRYRDTSLYTGILLSLQGWYSLYKDTTLYTEILMYMHSLFSDSNLYTLDTTLYTGILLSIQGFISVYWILLSIQGFSLYILDTTLYTGI